jgi:hypothetical protein
VPQLHEREERREKREERREFTSYFLLLFFEKR